MSLRFFPDGEPVFGGQIEPFEEGFMVLRVALLEFAMPAAHHCFVEACRAEYFDPLINVHMKNLPSV